MVHHTLPVGCDAKLQKLKNELEKENIMKTLVAAVALATLVATPVLAQTTKHTPKHSRAQVQQTYPQSRTTNQRHLGNAAHDSYDYNGTYAGSDPDLTVRSMLQFDSEFSDR